MVVVYWWCNVCCHPDWSGSKFRTPGTRSSITSPVYTEKISHKVAGYIKLHPFKQKCSPKYWFLYHTYHTLHIYIYIYVYWYKEKNTGVKNPFLVVKPRTPPGSFARSRSLWRAAAPWLGWNTFVDPQWCRYFSGFFRFQNVKMCYFRHQFSWLLR